MNKYKFASSLLVLSIGILIYFLAPGEIIVQDESGEGAFIVQAPKSNSEVCGAPEYAMVTAVVDGDTVIVEGEHWIRLLEMNADEKDEPCYDAAKNRLKELVLGKQVRLQKDISELDKYDRCLRAIFIGGENVNVKLVKEGQALAAFYGPDVKYRSEILVAQEYAKSNRVGCKWGRFIN